MVAASCYSLNCNNNKTIMLAIPYLYLYLLFLHNHYAIGFLFVLLMIIIIITSPQYLDLWVLIICAKNWASSREYIPSLALPGAAELSHEEVPYLVKEELVVVMGVWFVASASCLSCVRLWFHLLNVSFIYTFLSLFTLWSLHVLIPSYWFTIVPYPVNIRQNTSRVLSLPNALGGSETSCNTYSTELVTLLLFIINGLSTAV